MLKSSLCDYSDVYILVKKTKTVVQVGATAVAKKLDRNDKQVILKNCASFTDCLSDINNTKLVYPKELDAVMSMYSLIQFSDSYSNHAAIRESESFKLKSGLLNNTNNSGTINVEIIVSLLK